MKNQQIIIQQLLEKVYFNLNNYNQTFTKHNNQYFIDNQIGNLYQIISFNSKHQTYTIQEITE